MCLSWFQVWMFPISGLFCVFLISLLPSSIVCDRRPDRNCNLCVFPKNRFVSSISSVFCFRCVVPCGSLLRSRATPDCSWSSPASPATRTTCFCYSVGPRANFAAFVEWTMARNGSLFSSCSQENLASSTPDPVPSPCEAHA